MSLNNANQNVPLATPEKYRILHRWAQSPRFIGRTLGEIFELEGGAQALLEMAEWKELESSFPGERQYLEEFIARDPKRKAVFDLVRQEMKKRRRKRRGPTFAEQEKLDLFGMS